MNRIENQMTCQKSGAIVSASLASVATIVAAVALVLLFTVPAVAAIAPYVAIAGGGLALVSLITAILLFVAKQLNYKAWAALQVHNDDVVIEIGAPETLDLDQLTVAQKSTLNKLNQGDINQIMSMPKKKAEKILNLPPEDISKILAFRPVVVLKILTFSKYSLSELLSSIDSEKDIKKFLEFPRRQIQAVLALPAARQQRFYGFLIKDCLTEDNVDWILDMLSSPSPDNTLDLIDYKKFLYIILNLDLKAAVDTLKSEQARTYYEKWFGHVGDQYD